MLKKQNVSQAAATLDRPFSMMNLAFVGDIAVSVYICQGALDWHRHLDVDELFWVHNGTILLESKGGKVQLRPGEMAVVPKGVSHRSRSGLRASVLLLRCGVTPDRKNGRRRLYAIADKARLQRVNLRGVLQSFGLPFQFQTVARIEESVVQVAQGEGTWPVEIPVSHDVMLFILSGTATVRAFESMIHLHASDLVVVPRGTIYQLSTTRDTALVQVTRESE
jgi:mannose-6-phosphate isomerase-like protein (cupin superfamily)